MVRRLIPALVLALMAPLGIAKVAPSAAQEMVASPDQAEAAIWVSRFLTRLHYSSRPLDDTMSREIYRKYLESLDGDRWFLTATDIEAFKPYELALDDAIARQDLAPAYAMYKVYAERVTERTAYSRELLKKGFDFTVDERFDYDREKVAWAKDPAELDDLWRKRVKNDWMRLKLAGRADADIVKTLDKRYREFGKRVGELDGDDVFRTFLNAYSTAIEPHTNYLSPRDSETFAMQMRLSLEGIGAVLQKDEDYVIVRSVVRGGPAEGTGEVKPGDRILAVGQGEKGPMVDVVGWRTDDAVDLIRGKRGTIVRLDLLPAEAGTDGKSHVVTIKRDKVKLEEQAAKGKIIEVDAQSGDQKAKIGVIDLPAFYSDFAAKARGDADARSSTRDMRDIVLDLKKKGMTALVIDLRNNGGGALQEATELTGLFIDKGPVVQVRNGQGRVEVEGDDDAGTVWDGPLVLVVSRASASATEIFAGAIQDYGRGLVVGETTFGKGTVQNLIDLDQAANSQGQKFGQLKMTIAQYFRVSGGSTQHRGVVPDIAFPQTISPDEYGESSFDNALPYASVKPATFEKLGRPSDLVPILTARHTQRAEQNREYQFLLDDLSEVRKLRKEKSVSLQYTQRKQERDELDAKRVARKAERTELGGFAAQRKEAKLDDGLDANERLPDEDEADKDDETPDVLLVAAAQIAADLDGFSDPQVAMAMREAYGKVAKEKM